MQFDIADDDNFTFVDFLPDVRQQGGIFTSSVYETFRTLVDRANDFLRSNRKWEVVTCESVEFNSIFGAVAHLAMKYQEYGDSRTSYVRGLRVWLRKRNDDIEREQQIGYINLIPQLLDAGGVFSSPTFETLDAAIERFNSMNHSNPIPGRIINIESQEMKVPFFTDFDPDRCGWSERGSSYTRFIFVLRIFYEIMDGISEKIGVKDFIPDLISVGGGILSLPKYERFSNVVNKASAWLAQRQDLRFCNAQTLEIKQKSGGELDTRRMNYTEHGSRNTYYVRILRLAYTKPFMNSYSLSENPYPIRAFTCRTFPPMQLTTGCFPTFENLLLTRQRISAWVKATRARVVSSETTAYRLRTGGERKQGTEASFTYNINGRTEDWIFVIRLYLDGVYEEPPAEMLPAPPVIEDQCCCLVS